MSFSFGSVSNPGFGQLRRSQEFFHRLSVFSAAGNGAWVAPAAVGAFLDWDRIHNNIDFQ
jgi:hypothetical protein